MRKGGFCFILGDGGNLAFGAWLARPRFLVLVSFGYASIAIARLGFCVSVRGVEVPLGSVASRGRGELCTMLEILVLSLSMTRPSSSESWFWSTGKCEQVIVLVQSTKLVYMRRSLVYILRASW